MAKPDHEYLPITGIPEFNALSARLAFGDSSAVVREHRNATVQALSGTGSLRVRSLFCQVAGRFEVSEDHVCKHAVRMLISLSCETSMISLTVAHSVPRVCMHAGGRRVPGAALPGEDGVAAGAHLAVAQQDLPAGGRDRRARVPLLQALHARPGL